MTALTNSEGKEMRVLFPEDNGIVKKISPLLQSLGPFSSGDSPAEFALILKNNTKQRIEGWLTITPPSGWQIAPGRRLMIAIRALGTISAEFYLLTPARLDPGPNLLRIEIGDKKELLARADFDLKRPLPG
ncbi:MAG: hypothetical protein GX335_06660 [Firmicutes bacterium]|nr:hypothetical protein [Bacillota bacterium]